MFSGNFNILLTNFIQIHSSHIGLSSKENVAIAFTADHEVVHNTVAISIYKLSQFFQCWHGEVIGAPQYNACRVGRWAHTLETETVFPSSM